MSGARVLVTGGAGFIGSHVARQFEREGYRVRVLDDLSSGAIENCDPSWELLRASVCEPDVALAATRDVERVVHLAAFTSVPESFDRFQDCYHSNVFGTHNLLEACRRNGVRKVVFASSSAVYAELPEAPKREEECPDPISPYAVSKLEGEHLLEAYRRLHGLESAALRFFNVYGPRQAADSDYAAAVAIFAERGIRGEALTIYGDGLQTRAFVYVADVADAVLRASAPGPEGVFNVGSGEPTSVLALADTIAASTGLDSAHRFESARAGDIRSSTADLHRSRATLAWRAHRTLAQGLEPTLAFYRERAVGATGKSGAQAPGSAGSVGERSAERSRSSRSVAE